MHHYFSHDSNARHHEKLIALRMKHGWAGYGLYWAIIEKLREASEYKLSCNYELIAFDLHVDCPSVESIIKDFGLFAIEDGAFYSESLCERMQIKDAKSRQAREAALTRWKRYKSSSNKKTAKKQKTKITPKASRTKFAPPALEEVSNYCNERQNSIDASKFIDFYAAKGWMIGKNQMKDWRAAVRTWERTDNKEKHDRPATNTRIHPALQP